ncbi:hypothetical protein HIM_03542 [Hirsutella minnesotensis 3608]|uniref:HhH-GPD domain-containing protein n=1 Tax=Hirsutella minnesotensis 3608 TaxID=1043627 RepID=A0A0F7ZMG6_9HYPO|nr:hypothetical protein HIM_03542 [Hirsutella minnesotensis 3608]
MAASTSTIAPRRRSARNLKREPDVKNEAADDQLPPAKRRAVRKTTVKEEDSSLSPPPPASTPVPEDSSSDASEPASRKKRIKRSSSSTPRKMPSKTPSKAAEDRAAELQARKLKSFSAYATKSPFPDMARPSRPDTVVAPTSTAGCGNSPSVLDALVRTILSQNTSDRNSSRAKRSMDDVYGGSDRWDAIVAGGQAKLQRAIQSGGLSVVKSKAIIGILQQAKEKYGTYSLDHLFSASDEDAMREMLSFQGVGPKTASCVLLFCLRRESFAVDTHVYRITGLLGWRPPSASREEAQAHLDARVPDEEKYPLHVLIIAHGKGCDECRAGGKNLGKCELRKAFRRGRLEGKAGEDMKQEELEAVKKEEGDD